MALEEARQPEQQRAQFEHFYARSEHHRTFLEALRTEVAPYFENSERSREFANNYAQSTLRSLFFLNGGSLVAFPAFAELVQAGLAENIGCVLLSMGSFVVGLAASVLASLYAFLCMDADAACMREVTHRLCLDRQDAHYPSEPSIRFKPREASREEDDFRATYQRGRRKAVMLGLFSLFLFVVGAVSAAFVLSSATPGPSTA